MVPSLILTLGWSLIVQSIPLNDAAKILKKDFSPSRNRTRGLSHRSIYNLKSLTGFACKIRPQIKIERIMQNQFLKLNIKHNLRRFWTANFFFENFKEKFPNLAKKV